MSQNLIIASGVCAVFLIALSVRIYSWMKFYGKPHSEWVSAYRSELSLFFSGKFHKNGMIFVFHYLLLHLIVPLSGFGFFLRSDLNFLVFIGSVYWSMQLVQKLYPVVKEYEELNS